MLLDLILPPANSLLWLFSSVGCIWAMVVGINGRGFFGNGEDKPILWVNIAVGLVFVFFMGGYCLVLPLLARWADWVVEDVQAYDNEEIFIRSLIHLFKGR
jgi:hypothetical protein